MEKDGKLLHDYIPSEGTDLWNGGGVLLAVDVRRGHDSPFVEALDKSVVDSCLYTASGVCSAGSAHVHKAVFVTRHCSLV